MNRIEPADIYDQESVDDHMKVFALLDSITCDHTPTDFVIGLRHERDLIALSCLSACDTMRYGADVSHPKEAALMRAIRRAVDRTAMGPPAEFKAAFVANVSGECAVMVAPAWKPDERVREEGVQISAIPALFLAETMRRISRKCEGDGGPTVPLPAPGLIYINPAGDQSRKPRSDDPIPRRRSPDFREHLE